MRRNTFNFILDALLAVGMLGLLFTGLLIRWVLPHGSGSNRLLLGMDRHEWGTVHFWVAIGLVSLLVLHLALHWGWAWITARNLVRAHDRPVLRRPWRNLAGAAVLLAVAIGTVSLLWIASARIEVGAQTYNGHRSPNTSDIRGSMTLAEAAAVRHVDVVQLIERLNLPAGTSADTRLSVLRDQGLTLSAVRRTLDELAEVR